MSHPFNEKRDHKVQHARVADITAACGGRMAKGGSAHSDVAEDKALIHKMVKKSAMRASGGAVKARSDRPARAWGGRTKKGGKKKSGHTVNVIVGAHPPSAPPIPGHLPTVPGVAAGAAPPPPVAPPPMAKPMVPPPPGPMGGPPGVPGMPPGIQPPGMPMRKRGGAVFSGNLKANKVAQGVDGSNTDDSSSAGAGKGRTGIRRSYPSNKQDTPNIGRGAVVTKADGGSASQKDIMSKIGVRRPQGRDNPNEAVFQGMSGPLGKPGKATGGPIMSDSKRGVDMGPEFTGGARGGFAKLEKAARLRKTGYGKPGINVKNPTQNPSPGSGRG